MQRPKRVFAIDNETSPEYAGDQPGVQVSVQRIEMIYVIVKKG
jgi:hypothetical protein